MTRYIPPEENKTNNNTNTNTNVTHDHFKRNAIILGLIIPLIIMAIVYWIVIPYQELDNSKTLQLEQKITNQDNKITNIQTTIDSQNNRILDLQKRIHDLQSQQDHLESCMTDSSYWRLHKQGCINIGVTERP